MKFQLGMLGVCLALLISIPSQSQSCADFEVKANIDKVLPRCNGGDGSILLQNTRGGFSPYTYQLDTTKTTFGAFFELDTGIYSIKIRDSRGCMDTIVVELIYDELDQLIKPFNAFTPNGDMMNDRWIIPGIESFQGSEVKVFNRWGQQVHVNSPYSNENGWDGNQGGSELPEATYYYVITVFNDCKEESLGGSVTIIR
jgi:gliding motility-associated-like protein